MGGGSGCLRSHVDDEFTSVRTSRWHDEWLRHHVVPRHCHREIGAGRGNQHHLHFGDRFRRQLLIMPPRDQLTEADLRFPTLDPSDHVIGIAGSNHPECQPGFATTKLAQRPRQEQPVRRSAGDQEFGLAPGRPRLLLHGIDGCEGIACCVHDGLARLSGDEAAAAEPEHGYAVFDFEGAD